MIDLRLGDALDPERGLPTLGDRSVDVVITDPPFDARTHAAALEVGDRRNGDRVVRGAIPFLPLTPEKVVVLGHYFVQVGRAWIIIFVAERQIELWAVALEKAGARVVRVGVARRTNPRPQLSGDRPAPAADHVVIAHVPKTGRMRWNGGGRAATWDSPAARYDRGGQVHPTQKPLALMRQLVEDFSSPGEKVVDPFAGSGTTAVACKELGRAFIGWEVNPTYHAIALKRVDGAREQLPLRGFGR